MEDDKLSNILAGISGEYFVAAELSRRGFITTLTLKNTKGVDILASDQDAKSTVAIQVKTTLKTKNEWLMNEKSESFISDTHFYVFVRLKSLTERPEFFIVPSKDVALSVKTDHEQWLARPSRAGSPHKATTMRKFYMLDDTYKDRWDLLTGSLNTALT